jgi:hypothetical protein
VWTITTILLYLVPFSWDFLLNGLLNLLQNLLKLLQVFRSLLAID